MIEHKVEQNPENFPTIPIKLEETGLNFKFISALLLKSMSVLGLETNVEIAAHMKLSQGVVDDLLNRLKQQGLIETLGLIRSVARYSLTVAAKDLAVEAARQSEYVGPAPVTLKQYQDQVRKQSLSNERVSIDDLAMHLSHLILPGSIIRRLGPAINSARSLLIYGPPGNGKTSISEAIGQVYKQPVFVPYCVEVDGQVVNVFDRRVHSTIQVQEKDSQDHNILLSTRQDPRWVKCRRPIVITGGELTLQMLDLAYDAVSRCYQAPPQMKASGGVFVIDDFGRQLVQPCHLLNRWIVPLEKRVDYLTIHTGKTFDVPFDELVIFSTNLSPGQLMDPGQLRRVKYKLRIDPPSMPEFVTIFQRVCKQYSLDLPDEVLAYLLEDFYPRTGVCCAGFHPEFIVEHAVSSCRYRGEQAVLTEELVKDAMENLYVFEPEQQSPVRNVKQLPLAKIS